LGRLADRSSGLSFTPLIAQIFTASHLDTQAAVYAETHRGLLMVKVRPVRCAVSDLRLVVAIDLSREPEFLASMAGETKPGKAVPLLAAGKCLFLEVHKVFWPDELERMRVAVGEGLQQHHANRAGRKRESLRWNGTRVFASSTIDRMAQREGATLGDIAATLGLSISTVSRALRDYPGLTASTKARVFAAAKALGYRPNLAARSLVSRRTLRIAAIIPLEIRSVYDLVRRGIHEEAESFRAMGVELVDFTFPRLGEGEASAFRRALNQGVDGIILIPGDLAALRPLFSKAAKRKIPVVCLLTDAPGAEKLSTVAPNALSCGAIAGEIMGRVLGPKGSVAVTTGDLAIVDHKEKFESFRQSVLDHQPDAVVHAAIENQESERAAYEKTLAFLRRHPKLGGLYISTGNGAPVLRAVAEASLAGQLTIFSTNLFDELVPRLRSGMVFGTFYERPYSHGQIAFRLLYDYLSTGRLPPARVALEPFLIMRSNLDCFLNEARSTGEMAGHNVLNRALLDETFVPLR
jgi:LacI family transcriptional regulator